MSESHPVPPEQVRSVGIILAGGQSSRMHYQDKALLPLGDKRVVDHVQLTLTPQVERVAINANRNLEQYQRLGIPVLTDLFGPNAGPIAGIYTGMLWAKANFANIETLFCCPADVPWFPDNTKALLTQTMRQECVQVTWLCTDGQWQPLFSLWSIDTLGALENALAQNLYSPMALIRSLPNAMITLNNCGKGQFANLNSPEDLENARALLPHRH